MPVTPTDNPDIVRVSFMESSTDTHSTEIVCFVEATDDGLLRIRYDHHRFHTRETGKGTWDPPNIVRQRVTNNGLEAAIKANVMYELFGTFVRIDDSIWPVPSDGDNSAGAKKSTKSAN